MKWAREKFKVPTEKDYLAATFELDARHPGNERLMDAAMKEARQFPAGYKSALHYLIPEIVPDRSDRAERLDTLRALAIGAGVGVLLSEVAHDRPNIIHVPEAKVSAIHMSADKTPQEMTTGLQQEFDDGMREIVGEGVAQWIAHNAEIASGTGIISRRHRLWLSIGAGISINTLYGMSVENSV